MSVDEIFERFEIEFDAGAEPVFHGGELVTGSLRVNLKKRITINAIRLQFKGRSCWLVPDKHGAQNEKEKVYFDKDFVLLERPPGHPEPGHFPWNANFTYSLPFECPLPKGCPTSYESPSAFVRYYARCTIETDEQTKFLVKKAFSVVAPPELRQLIPPPDEPISRQDVATFGGCCCRGKISAEISLPKHAYAPGEAVIGTLSVDNRHPKNLAEQIEVRLIDRVKRAVEISPPIETKLAESTISAHGDVSASVTASVNPNDADFETRNGVSSSDAQSQKDSKKEKKAAKKRVVKKYQKSDAPLVKSHGKSKHGEAPQRVLFARTLTKEDIVPLKESTSKSELHLFTIPPVPTSVVPDSAEVDVNEQLNSLTTAAVADGRLSKLLESPSTATFRFRRQPFLRIEYAIQVSIGSHLVIEMPIDIHPIPIYANGIDFRPFAAGPQPIAEADEAKCQPFHAPFTFTPLYPTYLTSPKPVKVLESNTVTVNNAESIPTTTSNVNEINNGDVPKITTTIHETTVELPDGSILHDRKKQQITTSVTTTETNAHPENKIEPSSVEISINKPDSSSHTEQLIETHIIRESTSANATDNERPPQAQPSEVKPEEIQNTRHHEDSTAAPTTDSNIAPEMVAEENTSLQEVPNGIVEEPKESNGVEVYGNGVADKTIQNGVIEQTETEQEELPNGHIVQTTTTTRTTANGDEAANVVETTVEKIEYDENGVEVRKQNSTTKSEQKIIIIHDGSNADAVTAE